MPTATALPDFGYQASGAEKQLEIYYRFKLNSQVELTPDFQWIRQPGGDAGAQRSRSRPARQAGF